MRRLLGALGLLVGCYDPQPGGGETVELLEGFETGLGQWMPMVENGAWTATDGAARIASMVDSDDYLAYRLSSPGNFRITVKLTVDALLGGPLDDRQIGISVPYDPNGDAGAECSLLRDVLGARVSLWDLGFPYLEITTADFSWGAMSYTLVVTVTGGTAYDCAVDPGAAAVTGTAKQPVGAGPYVVIHASGVVARIDSVLVMRLP